MGTKIDERISLELLENYLTLNQNPRVFIETAEMYRERKKEKLAQILDILVDDIRAGERVVEAMYQHKLISPDTYLYLSALEESSMLIPSLVRDIKERIEFLKETEKEIRNAMIQPFITILIIVLAGIVLEKKVIEISNTLHIELDSMYFLQIQLAKHPLIVAPLYVVVLALLSWFLAKLIIKYRIEIPKKIFEISSLAKVLTQAKQPLRRIFLLLEEKEKSSRWKRIFIQIAESYGESFRNQLKPILKFLDTITAVRFLLLAERSQTQAWEFLRNFSKSLTKERVELIKNNIGLVFNLLTWIMLAFLALPFVAIFKDVMSKLSF